MAKAKLESTAKDKFLAFLVLALIVLGGTGALMLYDYLSGTEDQSSNYSQDQGEALRRIQVGYKLSSSAAELGYTHLQLDGWYIQKNAANCNEHYFCYEVQYRFPGVEAPARWLVTFRDSNGTYCCERVLPSDSNNLVTLDEAASEAFGYKQKFGNADYGP